MFCQMKTYDEKVAEQIERAADDLGNTMMPKCYSYPFHMSCMQVAFAFTGRGMARRRFPPSLCTTATRIPGDSPRCYSPISRFDLGLEWRLEAESTMTITISPIFIRIHLFPTPSAHSSSLVQRFSPTGVASQALSITTQRYGSLTCTFDIDEQPSRVGFRAQMTTRGGRFTCSTWIMWVTLFRAPMSPRISRCYGQSLRGAISIAIG